MTTLYLCQPAALHFSTPPGHPERADRIWVIERTLEQERFAALTREQAPAAEIEAVSPIQSPMSRASSGWRRERWGFKSTPTQPCPPAPSKLPCAAPERPQKP